MREREETKIKYSAPQPLPLLALNSPTTNNELSPTRLILTGATPNLPHSNQILHQPMAISTILPQLPTQPLPLMSLNSPITSSEINFPSEPIPLTDSATNDIHDIGSENMTTLPNGSIEYSLPYGWKKICKKRTDNRWDIHVTTPNGKRLRSSVKIKEYLSLNPGIQCDVKVTNTNRPNQYSSKKDLNEKTEDNGINQSPNQYSSKTNLNEKTENNGINQSPNQYSSQTNLNETSENNGVNQNISDAQFYCFQCSVTFPTQDFLKYHLATVHPLNQEKTETAIVNSSAGNPESKVQQCLQCLALFSSEQNLNYHVANDQCEGRSSKHCFKCSETFPTQDSLERHLATVHGGKKYQCNICQYETKRKHDFKRHMLKRHLETVQKEQENILAVQDLKQEFVSNDDNKILEKLPYLEPANSKGQLTSE